MDTKEKVFDIFKNYFDTIENEYCISNDQIQFLLKNIKNDINNYNKYSMDMEASNSTEKNPYRSLKINLI